MLHKAISKKGLNCRNQCDKIDFIQQSCWYD